MHWWHWLERAHLFGFPLLVAAGFLAKVVARAWQRVRENSAVGWPVADTLVLSADVAPKGDKVEVSYRYYAISEYRYGKYRRHFRRKAEAETFAEACAGSPCRCDIAMMTRTTP